jgi:hypothetical protein
METRRTFLTGLVLAGACSGLAGSQTRDQNPASNPVPRNPPTTQAPDSDLPTLPNPDKKILENNDKDMKKKVEQLYELAKELKDQVQNTDSSKVMNLDLIKKADEIEKLAHDIKIRSKGS